MTVASKNVFCGAFFFLDSIHKVEGLHPTLFLCSLNSERQKKYSLFVASLILTKQVLRILGNYPQISFLVCLDFIVLSVKSVSK